MRGRILEVPNLLDYTLLWEPRRGVAGLANVGRDECDGATKSATVQESQDSARLAGCNSARWHESVAPVQDGTKRCATVRDEWN